MKNQVGNKSAIFACLGATNHSTGTREENDYYATNPKHTQELLELESFNNTIWECAVGGGHIASVLEKNGYEVFTTDIVNRGYHNTYYYDFLKLENNEKIIEHWHGDIITNPPYKYAKEFIEKCIEVIDEGNKVAMFLKLTFLEGPEKQEKNFLIRILLKQFMFIANVRIVQKMENLKNIHQVQLLMHGLFGKKDIKEIQ